MPHISELDDFFFGLHYILGKKLVYWEVTFSFGLHFIALHYGGQKFGQIRGGVKFAQSPPSIGFLFFPDFQLPGTREIFKHFFRDSELDYFAFFSGFQISFLAFCYVVLTNLVRIFQFFRQIEEKILISQA